MSVAAWGSRARRLLPGAALVACLLPAAFLGGCGTPEARHKVLTFFFTGVPDPNEFPEEDLKGADGRTLSVEERREAALRAKRRAIFRPPTTYAHAPAASDQCQFCHQMGSGSGVGGRRIGPEMVAGIDKLCTGCHDDKDRGFAESLAMVSHPPAGDGQCNTCHDPHLSGNRYMLRDKDRQGLCLRCHTGKVAPIPPPGPHAWIFGLKVECTECHNPHFGKTTRMFRSDFDERGQRYEMDRAGGSRGQ